MFDSDSSDESVTGSPMIGDSPTEEMFDKIKAEVIRTNSTSGIHNIFQQLSKDTLEGNLFLI